MANGQEFIEVMRQVLFVDGEDQEKEVKNAKDALETLEGELKGNKFFGGESVGFVDIVLGFISIWFEVIEEVACVKVFDSQKFPSLAKWMEDFLDVPEIKENFAGKREFVAIFSQDPPIETGYGC
ncbi:hypothetical protein Acr_10g0002630 [Actinidia rufa]|uniref:GST C-terminal domain-containing protein n=1 Tax=Actinidia rufa TaxID=165716 RepID=A0A7J0F850_9ERIC|nr:hypothetical protein Acr_10g0002630 [Actinidia rufa]